MAMQHVIIATGVSERLFVYSQIDDMILLMCSSAREFIDCIGHIRLLSWLLLGSLTHTAMYGATAHQPGYCAAQPIPQESSCQVADHIQVILAGFAEQPKASVLHMSSLFHVFILCQVNIFSTSC